MTEPYEDNDEWDGFINIPPPKIIATYVMVEKGRFEALTAHLNNEGPCFDPTCGCCEAWKALVEQMEET